ncbi:MAG: spore cortex biosynthesis protein YabQ [Ignavibacteriales bacterium]
MILKTQILLLFFSFVFGAFFSFFLNINYKFIYGEKRILKILVTFSFVMVNVLLYFMILEKINNGIIHPYAIMCIILGFLFDGTIQKMVAKQYKK